MKAILYAGLIGALIWSIGGWFVGGFDANPKEENSWLIGIPYLLFFLTVLGAVVGGRTAVGPKQRLKGIFMGCCVGVAFGFGAVFVFVFLGRLGEIIPFVRGVDTRILWVLGGSVAGAGLGSLGAIVWKAVADVSAPP